MSIKLPLSVYVIKHPENIEAYQYIQALYSDIFRNFTNTCEITCNVPVYYTNSTENKDNMLYIDTENSELTAIILLLDKKMILDEDSGWEEYFAELISKYGNTVKTSVFPVSFEEECIHHFDNILSEINHICIFNQERNRKIAYFLFSIKHNLCRMMLGAEQEDFESLSFLKPVKLFLSHTKSDGLEIVNKLRNFIVHETGLKEFFDAVEIPQGSRFLDVIQYNINRSDIFIIVRTDDYSKSEWCKNEVVCAKMNHNMPIIVIDYMLKGEKRIFPYMGNVRCYRCNRLDDNFCLDIISIAMSELLSKQVYHQYVKNISEHYKIPIRNNNIFDYPPELLSLMSFRQCKQNYIVYPEPPLGKTELDLLSNYRPDLKFVTPIMLPTLNQEKTLAEKKIAISISESEFQYQNGITHNHCDAIAVDISKYLLCNKACICYGGDTNYENGHNFTNDLIKLMDLYSSEYLEHRRLINYVPGYLTKQLDEKKMVQLSCFVKFIFGECSDEEGKLVEPMKRHLSEAIDLTKIREKITNDCDAKIVLGGKIEHFRGIYPGILEEVLISIRMNKPVFILGGFGGMASEIAKCIMGDEQNLFSSGFLEKRNRNSDFTVYYNHNSNKCNQINYHEVGHILRNMNLSKLNNNLSKEENLILLCSRNVNEIISLILKGLLK